MSITLHRIKQFFKGITAYGYTNYEILDKYLNKREKELFNRLPAHEKRHAIDTAKTILKLNVGKSEKILMKAALLHDIGKIKGKIGVIKKSILVLFDKFLPAVSMSLSQKVNMFNIYYNHPSIGASLLRDTGTEDSVILLVKYHHCEKNADIKGMDILKNADSLN